VNTTKQTTKQLLIAYDAANEAYKTAIAAKYAARDAFNAACTAEGVALASYYAAKDAAREGAAK